MEARTHLITPTIQREALHMVRTPGPDPCALPPLPCLSCREPVAGDDGYPAPKWGGGCMTGEVICGECWGDLYENAGVPHD